MDRIERRYLRALAAMELGQPQRRLLFGAVAAEVEPSGRAEDGHGRPTAAHLGQQARTLLQVTQRQRAQLRRRS